MNRKETSEEIRDLTSEEVREIAGGMISWTGIGAQMYRVLLKELEELDYPLPR